VGFLFVCFVFETPGWLGTPFAAQAGFFFSLFVVLGFDLRSYTLSHSTSHFL
jgi:hypothetical protein